MLRTASLLVCVLCATLHAQRSPAVAELVADASSIRPGQEFTVGVLITMRPKWHVYWKYPGEAGLPTGVKFAASGGVTISELRWPTPMTFEQAGKKVGFGYTNTVLLTAKAKAADDLKVGQTVSVTADADWLCCETECLPGSKKMTLKLLVSDSPIKSYQKLFEDWEKRLPAKGDASAPKLNPVIDNNIVSVTLPAGASLYPAPPAGVTLSNLRVEKQGDQSVMIFAVNAKDDRATIPAVLAIGGKAHEVEVPVK
jgi:DsbC/DsbD-like thiol-disulfide interchange protein